MRNEFVPDPAIDRSIGTSPEPTPAVVCIRILRVNHKGDRGSRAGERSRDAKDKLVLQPGYLEQFGTFAFAPPPALPSTNECIDLAASDCGRKEQFGVEGQEDRGSFPVLPERNHRRADFAIRAERQVEIKRIGPQF